MRRVADWSEGLRGWTPLRGEAPGPTAMGSRQEFDDLLSVAESFTGRFIQTHYRTRSQTYHHENAARSARRGLAPSQHFPPKPLNVNKLERRSCVVFRFFETGPTNPVFRVPGRAI